MKKIILATTLLFIAITMLAQAPTSASKPFPKTISVSGAAEMEFIPDEIYVNIELREYQKKGSDKKDIETIKSQFLGYCKEAGIADSNISIASYSGYNNYYRLKRKKKTQDMFAAITYQVKFKSSAAMDLLIEKLDDEATHDFDIVSTSHSKVTEFRKQLKILAVKAAKDKGIYLTEAIGEKLGDAIEVVEPNESTTIVGNYRSQMVTNVRSSYSGDSDDNKDIEFKKVKLRYEVKVVFALQ